MAKGLRAKSEKRKRAIKRQKVAKLEQQRLQRIVARLHEQIHRAEETKKVDPNNAKTIQATDSMKVETLPNLATTPSQQPQAMVTVDFDSDIKEMEIGSTKLLGAGVKKKKHKKTKKKSKEMMRESAENPNQNGVSNQIKTFLLVSLKRQQIYLIHILRPQTGRQLSS
jgi:hypothetical protein